MPVDREASQAKLAAEGIELGAPVCGRRRMEATAPDIWRAISRPGYLIHYHPFCRANDVEQWPGVGARDTVTYYSGVHYQRDFIEWIDGVGYDIEVGPPPRKTARVAWRIIPIDETHCELLIEVTPYLKSEWPESRKQGYQQRYFSQVIADYLDSVVRGVDHFVTTGQSVRQDQFGRHPLYSGRDAC